MINESRTDVVPDIKAAGRLLLARERLLEHARFFSNFAFDFFGFKINDRLKKWYVHNYAIRRENPLSDDSTQKSSRVSFVIQFNL